MGVFFVPSDSHKTLLYGVLILLFCHNTKSAKKIVKPKKKYADSLSNKWHNIHPSANIGKIWKLFVAAVEKKKLTARKSKIFAGYRVAEFCRNGLRFTQLCEHKFTWRCSWNLMGKICVMAAFALEFQTVQDGRGL